MTGADPKALDGRAEAVRAAVASARIEGVEVTPETQAALDAYVTGAIDADELVAEVLRLYGPGA